MAELLMKFPLQLVPQPEAALHKLDPKLQDLILTQSDNDPRYISNRNLLCDPLLDRKEIDTAEVVVRLADPAVPVAGLRLTTIIGEIGAGEADIADLVRIRQDRNVLSLKLSQWVWPELNTSIGEITADTVALQSVIGRKPVPTGRDTILGVIDIGLDLRHPNFLTPANTTRVLSLWAQNQHLGKPPSRYGYGVEITQAEINAALAANPADPYARLNYKCATGSHGTRVTDVAAGNGRGTAYAGVAPEADIVFVDCPLVDSYCVRSTWRRLIDGADYIFRIADALGKQAVVNLSFGTTGGSHDGTTLVERAFEAFVATPGRAVVVAAGNSRMESRAGDVTIRPSDTVRITWRIPSGGSSPHDVEIWYDSAAGLSVTLEAAGQRLGSIPLGTTATIRDEFGPIGRAVHRENDPNNGAHHLEIFLKANMPRVDWTIELTNVTTASIRAGVYVAEGPSEIASAVEWGTINGIACAEDIVTVGAYDQSDPKRTAARFSGRGPTRSGGFKPDLVAPGVDVLCATARQAKASRKGGTSFATPFVAGVVLLLMEAAGRTLNVTEIRKALLQTANGKNPSLNTWDQDYGFGRLDAAEALDYVVP